MQNLQKTFEEEKMKTNLYLFFNEFGNKTLEVPYFLGSTLRHKETFGACDLELAVNLDKNEQNKTIKDGVI
jgi:hypothetical protein